MNYLNLSALFAPMLALVGCALLPTASDNFQAPAGTVAAEIFDCADKKISYLKIENHLWDQRENSASALKEIYETNNFHNYNTIGIFTKISFNSTTDSGEIRIRAAGPYFVDLGARRELQTLKEELIRCLENKKFQGVSNERYILNRSSFIRHSWLGRSQPQFLDFERLIRQ